MTTTASGISSYEQACASTSGTCPSATTSPPTSATSTRATSSRWSGSATTAPPREVAWGELQDLSNQAAHLLREHGVGRGDRVAVVLPPTPETAAIFFGTWKLGAILLSMSVLYGDDGIRHRLERLRADGARHRRRQRRPLRRLARRRAARPRRRPARRRRRPTTICEDTSADDPAQLYYTSGTTGHGEGHRPRPPLHPRPRGVRLLPRRAGRRALPRHGGVGVGGGDRAAARPVAARRGPVRLPARGRLRPAQAARLPLPPRGHERLHDADRDAGDDGDRRRRRALPAAVPASSARPASRSTRRRSAGSASSTGSPCSTTTG